jgi:hypothetical protein
MRLSAYFAIIGAIHTAPRLYQIVPDFLFACGLFAWAVACAIHLYFGRDCEMHDDDQEW